MFAGLTACGAAPPRVPALPIDALAEVPLDRSRTLVAVEVLPSAGEGTYRRTSDTGGMSEHALLVEERAGGELVVTIEGIGRAFHTVDGDGNVRTAREEDFGEGVAVVYDPAIVMLPTRLEAGRKVESLARITVLNLRDRRRRDEGSVRVAVEVLGTAPVSTPAGDRDAVLVRTTRTIDLSLADATVASLRAWAKGEGVVAETVDRRLRALGIFGRDARYRVERVR